MAPHILQERAAAKINLTLDVLRRRSDGYHDIETVMQTVSLSDTVEVTEAGAVFSLVTDLPLPPGWKTLEQQAAEAFFACIGRTPPPLRVTLHKKIPAYAGLGGGSADAAAVLRYLRRRYAPDMSWQTLESLALTVGSDVPFCLRGGTVLAQGRGEILTPLPPLPPCWFVLVKPGFSVPTAAAFLRAQALPPAPRPSAARMRRAIIDGDLSAAAHGLGNVFVQLLDPERRREVEAWQRRLLALGAMGTSMSGSGPTVFGLFEQEAAARQAAEMLRREGGEVYTAQPLAAREV